MAAGTERLSASEEAVCGGLAPAPAPWARLLRLAAGKHSLALIDQAVVSGTSFLTTILIARWCGAEELGVYALGASLLVSWACVQESLVALPYTIYRHRPLLGTQAEYAGSALMHQGMLSALALVLLVAAALALPWGGAVPGLVAVVWALAGVMPFALLREFGRRFAFAHLRMREALALDVAVAVVQLTGLCWLASMAALSAITACAAIGAACALAGGAWLYLARRNFAIRTEQVGGTLRQSWSLGKWLFASQVTLSVQGYFVHWLLAWWLGVTATGVYVACLTVVLFSNPLILGISNALAPRAAQALADGGPAELRRVVYQTTLLVGAAMVVFCAGVYLGGEELMALLYPGSQYAGHAHTVTVLAVAMLAAALGMPASNALAAIERPDVIFHVGLVAVVLSVALVPCLVAGWDVTGAAYGFLAGNVAGSVGRWLAFTRLVGEGREEGAADRARVIQVLQQLTGDRDGTGWAIEQLSQGAQARIYVARRRDGRPVAQTHLDLAVKLYKPVAGQAAVLREQFESLARLHARLHGSTVHGWQVHVPLPLVCSAHPPALVMTLVPGTPLNVCLESPGAVAPEALASIAGAVVAALERCWSLDGQIHGDLNFDNVLCDVAARSLSFVDPGALEADVLCDGVCRAWYPASRDLAYLLFDTGVTVKRTFGRPGVRRRQHSLAEGVLRAFLKQVGPEQQEQLLDEIQACVEVHLSRVRVSRGPRGIWHRVVKRIASRRIHGMLTRLRARGPER
jgi:O-antigen/teichoic acid export membrane protein